jgi:hypothetical protein
MGFGSVFDGDFTAGHLANISTQGVFDLIKNVTFPGDQNSSVVEIGANEVDQFHLPRTETIIAEMSDAYHGNFVKI